MCCGSVRPPTASSPRLFSQGAHRLHDEEGIALGLLLQEGHEFGTQRRLAEHRLAELGHLDGREPWQRDHLGAGQLLRQFPPLVVAIGTDDQDRRARQPRQEARQKLKSVGASQCRSSKISKSGPGAWDQRF